MYMFQSTLEKIPKNRLDLVNDLEIPDVTLSPYILIEPEFSESENGSISNLEEFTSSSDSSLSLSRAMTDSEIDYGRAKRLKNRSLGDPWVQMRAALDAFPHDYLEFLNRPEVREGDQITYAEHLIPQLNVANVPLPPLIFRGAGASFQDTSLESPEEVMIECHRYNDELKQKMQRFFEEECTVFEAEDPGLIALEEALQSLELKDSDLDISLP